MTTEDSKITFLTEASGRLMGALRLLTGLTVIGSCGIDKPK